MTKLASTTSPTRERILSAAFTLFGRYGFRRTSMEDIANEAGLSRTALYLQFRNKEEIFRELAAGLHEEALLGAEAALDGNQPLADRLRAAVEAKTLKMIEIIQASPHGSELMDEKNRLCGDLATDSEQRFQEMLTRGLVRANEAREINLAASGLSASEAAELFAHSIIGLKGPDITIDRYRGRLASLVGVFTRGLGG
ncbi:MAG: TetR/AcrR family transcriptional regulator [Gaiellales bacterium]